VAQLPGDIVLAEGGPSLNGQLVAAGLVDELCVTIAPQLVSGSAERIAHGPAAVPAGSLELAHVLEDDGFLFCRYVRRESPPG
jgi:riboflavin biosynthesis pyrimidine reductase